MTISKMDNPCPKCGGRLVRIDSFLEGSIIQCGGHPCKCEKCGNGHATPCDYEEVVHTVLAAPDPTEGSLYERPASAFRLLGRAGQ